MNNALQPVTITLNGREVSGYPGMTILELANESGVYIPTLCHDDHLSPVGACRLCLVEDTQTGRLMASCVTPITAGMVIDTDSPRVVEHRKTIIKLLLASHPDSCLVCDKGNRCQLRKIATELGVGFNELIRIPKSASVEEVNPFIVRDLSKCVLCAKCIRACQELVVVGAIDYFQRGFISKVSTMNDVPLEGSECTFCGTCVAFCPTGALMEKDSVYTGTVKDIIETTCPYCGCGCTIAVEVKDSRIVRVRPGKEGINNGTLCVRGSYGTDFVHSPDRLQKPLINTEEGLEEASWEEALEKVAGEFGRIKDESGADSLAVLSSPRCTNEENYLLQRFARCILGTNNIDTGNRLYNPAGVLPGESGSLNDLEKSDVIMIIGADPGSSAPLVEYAVKRAVKFNKAKLILIDPGETGLSSFAHIRLQPKAGTDVALLNGIAKVITGEGLADFDTKSNEYKTYAGGLDKYTPDFVESVTGVRAGDIQDAARIYAEASRAAIVYGTGVTGYKSGADCVQAVNNLAVLTGNTEGGVYPLQRDSNSRGAMEMGTLPDFLPGYRKVTDGVARTEFEKIWAAGIPERPGLTAIEIMEQAKAGKIKALWIMGDNPLLSFPDRNLAEEALSNLELLVVQDIFSTETAEMATVVLPAASFAEKEGTFVGFEGTINHLNQAIEPSGESLPDWEIILRLAEKMDSPFPYTSLRQITDEIADCVYGSRASASVSGLSPVEYVPEKEGAAVLPERAGLYKFGSGTRSSRSSRLSKYANGDLVKTPVGAERIESDE
jgi:formate dehydrogenase alpha subunit